MKTLDALKYLSNQPLVGIDIMKSALAFNSPHIDDIRSDLTRTVAQVLVNTADKLGKEKSMEMLNIALEAMRANVLLHPYDIRNYLTLSQLSQVGYSLTNDTRYIGEYGNYLETALAYSPKRQQIIYNYPFDYSGSHPHYIYPPGFPKTALASQDSATCPTSSAL